LYYSSYISVLVAIILGIAARFISNFVIAKKKNEELQKQNMLAELEALKSQINPHFLFNALNTIYFGIDKENSTARNLVDQFSSILRYQLYECNAEEIPIEKEIEFLCNYIKLHQFRRDKDYKIFYSSSDTLNGFKVAPFLFIPLVENAFKHVSDHLDKENIVSIQIEREGHFLCFETFNTVDGAIKSSQNSTGIGLQNVKRRLDLIYDGKYTLDIERATSSFILKLKIDLS
jgi:LytS/YehU family sensor histidine kinase